MQKIDDHSPGASRDPEKALKREIETSLTDWQNRYGGIRLQLAYEVLDGLWHHIEHQHGMAALCEFYESSLEITKEQVRLIGNILEEDRRPRVVH